MLMKVGSVYASQLGPQQLKNMTVLRESSVCFRLSGWKAGEVVEKKRRCFCLEELLAESLRDFTVEACSFIP
ncbi:hypothetical protein Fmac_009903 [Flemingia macrophylla]|uniref:Uncharacterized protein n=1 Tax=Flemingia macrophylla TaxID=520843 RepID=A0ABD1N1N9_9FABA